MAKPRVPMTSLPRETIEQIDRFAQRLGERVGLSGKEIGRPKAIHIALIDANNKLDSPFTIINKNIKKELPNVKKRRFL